MFKFIRNYLNMKICIFTIFWALFPNFSQAQFLTDSLLSSHVEKLKNAKLYTLAVINLMPEALFDFKPIADEMTFKEQIVHIGQNLFWLSSKYIAEEANPSPETKAELNKRSKVELLTFISNAYDYAMKSCTKINSQNLAKQAIFFAGPKNKYQFLNLIQDHQTHHRAQIIVYLRLNGIKPPDYVGW